ncbi:hypothetical protein V6N12_031188 [Hibiscus sabdariffa]|uniref:Uncharacterized protein n=1 Tax=Hibiscus sabdariffa TaxID=183260 RepID=A0ABR2E895_9ROSI
MSTLLGSDVPSGQEIGPLAGRLGVSSTGVSSGWPPDSSGVGEAGMVGGQVSLVEGKDVHAMQKDVVILGERIPGSSNMSEAGDMVITDGDDVIGQGKGLYSKPVRLSFLDMDMDKGRIPLQEQLPHRSYTGRFGPLRTTKPEKEDIGSGGGLP